MGIHPTAIVSPGAEIGGGVEIGPYCVLGPRVRIGNGCRLHAHVVIDGDTWLGERCEVYPFASLGAAPQDKKLPRGDCPESRLRIGNDNRIREHVTIHGGTPFGGGVTRIGDDNMLLVGSHIGHDATVGSHVVMTNGAMVAGHTVVEDRAILGAMVGVHQFARVGMLAMVGAGAMLSHDAPPFSLVQGDRARLIGVNAIGMHRNEIPPEQIAAVKRVYRLLFWRAGNLTEKMDFVRKSPYGSDELCKQILRFLEGTRRGICMPKGSRRLGSPGNRDAEVEETA
ncbi:MAG: acyl-ACP--UDP-N-acetylglucosamine O-acyltransferase [Planctomycetota bacterium]